MTPRTGIVLGAGIVLARLGVAALHGGPIVTAAGTYYWMLWLDG
jgi:hypothetical protein